MKTKKPGILRVFLSRHVMMFSRGIEKSTIELKVIQKMGLLIIILKSAGSISDGMWMCISGILYADRCLYLSALFYPIGKSDNWR